MKLKNEVNFDPSIFSPEAIDFLSKMLTKDPLERLGKFNVTEQSLPEDYGSDIKSHPWFKDIDWELIAQKKHKARRPRVKDDGDTRHIDEIFLTMSVVETVVSDNVIEQLIIQN